MKNVYSILLKSMFRDPYTLVWSIIVPVGLLLGLGFYFDAASYKPILVTSVLAISVLFTNFNTPAFFIMKQRNRGVYKLLKATPFQTSKFVLALALATNTISAILSVILVLLSIFVLGVSLSVGQILSILLMMIIGAFCFICMGFFVANISKNENNVGMFTNLIMLPMIFTSGAFYSMEHAPSWLKVMGEALPFHYLIEFVKGIIIENHFYISNLAIFLLFILLAFGISIKTFRFE